MKLSTILIYVFCIAASLLAGIVGSLFTIEQIPTWYAGLVKPSWTPPEWVFGPVWNVLYVLMGTSAAIVWTRGRGAGRYLALWFFFAHLFVNTLWSIVFFGMQEVGAALVIIGILWVCIVSMIFWFKKYSVLAAWLLVPYLLWVTYASSLNAGILFLN